MNAVEDLAAWLTAAWDEEETLAKSALGRPWLKTKLYPDEPWHFLPLYQPELALARIAADRKILARSLKMIRLGEGDDPTGCWEMIFNFGWGTLEDLAEQYAGRPGYPLAVERQGVEQ